MDDIAIVDESDGPGFTGRIHRFAVRRSWTQEQVNQLLARELATRRDIEDASKEREWVLKHAVHLICWRLTVGETSDFLALAKFASHPIVAVHAGSDSSLLTDAFLDALCRQDATIADAVILTDTECIRFAKLQGRWERRSSTAVSGPDRIKVLFSKLFEIDWPGLPAGPPLRIRKGGSRTKN